MTVGELKVYLDKVNDDVKLTLYFAYNTYTIAQMHTEVVYSSKGNVVLTVVPHTGIE